MPQVIEEVNQEYQVDAHELGYLVEAPPGSRRRGEACDRDQGKSGQDNRNLRRSKVQWLFRKPDMQQSHGREMHHLGGAKRPDESCRFG